MLDPINAIRIEYRHYGDNDNRRKNYIFKCVSANCDNIIRVITSDLKKRTGLCISCTRRKRPFFSSYNHLKNSAKTNHPDKEFALTYEEFLFLTQIRCCHYCGGDDIVWTEYKTATSVARSNLDRKDNTKGYTPDNVVVCCKECNMMKRDWLSYEEFKAIRLFLKKWRNGSSEDKEELMYFLVSFDMKINSYESYLESIKL